MEINDLFDIVTCVGPNDTNILEQQINYTKKNIIGYRNIYLVCSNPNIDISGTIIIDEKMFPFKIHDIANIFGKNSNNGWYLQQLLKIYAGNIIPGILKKYLVIDCDTHFLKPTNFITDSKGIFTVGTEYHTPYFLHMNRLHPSLKKSHPFSGISHHMFFHTDRVNDLIKLVEDNFSNEKSFWKIFLENVDKNEHQTSGASEYEIYFTYMYLYHQNDIVIRELKWENRDSLQENNANNDFVSIHWYMRK